MSKPKWITVEQAIKLLQAMPDKTLKVLIDCPYCGKGSQISSVTECVVLATEEHS